MWIQVGNIASKLVKSSDEEREWLQEYLTFEGQRRGRVTAPPTRLFNTFANTYPSGMNPLVAKAGAAAGLEVKFIDKREAPCAPDPNADLTWLHDYQRVAVERVVAAKRGILWLPTGAGKTEVAVGITRALPTQWLALVHRSQLADDIASRFEKRTPGVYAGRVLEGAWDLPEDAPLIAATFQTIAAAFRRGVEDPQDETYLRALNMVTSAKGLLVDESHTLPAESFYRIATAARAAYYRVGLSGTPLARSDKKSMFSIAAIGPVIYRVRSQLLIDRGVLARPTVRMTEVTQHSNAFKYDAAYKSLIVKSKVRNAAVVELVKRATKPGFVFVTQVEHGKELVKQLFAAGLRAEFVWGAHSITYRKSLIRRMVSGAFDVLVCSSVFDTGIDVPELRSVIAACGGKSLIGVFQRLGRGMRVDRGKDGAVREGGDVFEVYDIADRGNKWLEAHANERRAAYAGEGYATFVEPQGLPAR